MAGPISCPRLTILGGPLSGRELTIDEAVDNILIGSDPSCRFHVDLPGVSPIHARLWVDLQGVTVYDTGAPEGVHVNDDRVVGSSPVRNGDILWLGRPGEAGVVMIQCRVPPRAGAATPPPFVPIVKAPSAEPSATVTFVSASEMEPGAAVPLEEFAVAPESTDATVALSVTPVPVAEAAPSAPPEPAVGATAAEETLALGAAEAMPLEPGDVAGAEAFEDEEPVKFTLDEPPLAEAPAPRFEEDIEEPPAEAPAPTVAEAPPAPALAAGPAPRTEPPPVRPTPAPRPVAAPAPAIPPRTEPPQPPGRPRAATPVGRYAALTVAVVLLLGAAGFVAWRFLLNPAPPEPTPAPVAEVPTPLPASAAPVPTPEITPSTEESVTIVKSPPSAAPAVVPPAVKPSAAPAPVAAKPTPPPPAATAAPPSEAARAQQAAAQAAALVTQADAALEARHYEQAASLYDRALQLDPQNAQAAKGRPAALAAATAARRSLTPGRSVLEGAKSGKKGPAGFESEDVQVAKAPDYSGRLEFESSPKNPRPGEGYSVKVYLLNDGKKTFKIASFSAVTTANGERSGGPMAPTVREVETQQRALVQELSGVWKEGLNSWSLEVTVASGHGETVRNTLAWK